jgi:hypothetical protein
LDSVDSAAALVSVAPVAGHVPGQLSHFSVHSVPAAVQAGQAADFVETVVVASFASLQHVQDDFSAEVETVSVLAAQQEPPSLQHDDFAEVATADSLQQEPLSLQQLPAFVSLLHIAAAFTAASESLQQLPIFAVTGVLGLASFSAAFSVTRL